jgi:hypothetical protein
MEYRQFFPDIEEAYPPGWNLETFKALNSFSKRMAYCNQNLKRISSGSGRIAYKVDEEKVLKLAKNAKGVAQNSVERDWYVQDAYEDVIAKVFDIDENDLWIEMELAKKISPSRFKALVGFTAEQVGTYLIAMDDRDNGRQSFRHLDSTLIQQMENNEWIQRVYTLCREVDLMPGDFGKVNSFGEVLRDGKPAAVIIDMGLNKATWKDFYS